MKVNVFLLGCILSLAAVGCGDSKKGSVAQLPTPGVTIDSVSEPVVEDELNNGQFTVVIAADSEIKSGVYDIRAEFGVSIANGKFTMPKGLDEYKLEIKKGDAPYTRIIGFRLPKDTAFHEYMLVKGQKSAIEMKYLKSYTFE